MTNFNEQNLAAALAGVSNVRFKPTKLLVTDRGIDFQAAAFRRGELTEAAMVSAGVPADLIEEVKRRGSCD